MDFLIFCSVFLVTSLIIRSAIRKYNQIKLEQELFHQKVAQDLAKHLQIKNKEQDKFNSLH